MPKVDPNTTLKQLFSGAYAPPQDNGKVLYLSLKKNGELSWKKERRLDVFRGRAKKQEAAFNL